MSISSIEAPDEAEFDDGFDDFGEDYDYDYGYDGEYVDGFGEEDNDFDEDYVEGAEYAEVPRRPSQAERRRATALARRRLLARERLAQRQPRVRAPRTRGVPAARRPRGGPSARRTSRAIRKVDLESKVATDSLRSSVAGQGKRMSRSEYASVAGLAVNQFIESFEQPKDDLAKAALRFSPLLLLTPQKQGTGAEAVMKDPRFIGAAVVAGIALAGKNRDKFTTQVRDIEILGPTTLVAEAEDDFVADPVDSSGSIVPDARVSWSSSNQERARVDANGHITAGDELGPVVISATSGGVTKRFRLVVQPATGKTGNS